MSNAMTNSGVLITGAAGFIGSALLRELATGGDGPVTALDLREVPPSQRLSGIAYEHGDIRDPALKEIIARVKPRTVVHLASVVAVGGDDRRDYEIDVLGTRNVLEACLAAGVGHLIVTSSGAAYGYHADNPVPLRETDPLRGNEDFPYARNKREVEEMLARWRSDHPQLRQTVFRPCTVLGPTTNNQITALFERPVVTGLSGTATPFSLIADSDVVAALAQAVRTGKSGIYNLAGDGTLSLREIARLNGKPFVPIPPAAMKGALWLLHALGLTKLTAQNVKFIQYRPVLDNTRLKSEFGYSPALDARAVFERYRDERPEPVS
ncbi:UDP-glucose 4-epimerase [Bradyrhizobium sp. NFR13]|uniref:SDR family oxidoreductase n=1 Tax=Bradyrhizobium sp. NFR13 TaxID=1566285 RepID=UPI0008E7EB1E|nr:SDR family oxidoreductase [Bradyrhizobium sp. NFR13]SFL30863.1 UDP-glucose 4-epimerase [Bradyrhizobium sp. NFR13]